MKEIFKSILISVLIALFFTGLVGFLYWVSSIIPISSIIISITKVLFILLCFALLVTIVHILRTGGPD